MNPGFHDGGEGNGAQLRSASYRLPALDQDFLLGDSMRGVRFLLEYGKAEEALRSLKEMARDETQNSVPVMVEAAKAYVTLGEMVETLKEEWGVYTEPPMF